MKTLILAACAALALSAAPALADDAGKEAQAKMEEYFRLWNAHDAAGVAQKAYHLETGNPMNTEAGVANAFAGLKAQGYDHSVLASLDTCLLTPTQAISVMRYSRIKTDGAAMPPKDRAGLYTLRKFPEGWRITAILGMDASATLSCKSVKG